MAQPTPPVAGVPPEPPATTGRILDRFTGALTSSVGGLTGLAAAIIVAANQFKALSDAPKAIWKGAPEWLGGAIVLALLLFLTGVTVWRLVEKRRIKLYSQIGGALQPGYFTLQPRETEEGFERADNAHIETLQWIETSESPVLYLTGASGTGKSSVLAAWVLPKLKAAGHVVIRLRGYEDLPTRIEEEILKPGVVWERPSRGSGDLRARLTRACKNIAPRRLFFVVDQFEEFLILKTEEQQQSFRQFLGSLHVDPVDGLTFLFAFRSEYEGIIDSQGWPQRLLRINRREIFPFNESAAQDFMNKSKKTLDPERLRIVLREASESSRAPRGSFVQLPSTCAALCSGVSPAAFPANSVAASSVVFCGNRSRSRKPAKPPRRSSRN